MRCVQTSGALILCAILQSMPAQAIAGSCCGGSSGGSLVVRKHSRGSVDIAMAWERYSGYWNQKAGFIPDPPATALSQLQATIGLAYRLARAWQAYVSLPYVWNFNKYPGLTSRTNAIGDAAAGIWFEALDDLSAWRIRSAKDLIPSVLIGISTLIPSGVSPYDNVSSSFDITGRGFYRFDGNLLVSKMIHPWSASLAASNGIVATRPVNREYGRYIEPYHKRLGNRFTASVSVNYSYYIGTAGNAITGTVSFSHLAESAAVINGSRASGSGFRKEALGAALAFSGTDCDWSLRAFWSQAFRADGWGDNFPATDIFTLGTSYAFR